MSFRSNVIRECKKLGIHTNSRITFYCKIISNLLLRSLFFPALLELINYKVNCMNQDSHFSNKVTLKKKK